MSWCAGARAGLRLGPSESVGLLHWVGGKSDAPLTRLMEWSCYGDRETVRGVVERYDSPSSVGDLKDRKGSPDLAKSALTMVLSNGNVLDLVPIVTVPDRLPP